jgi:hypothetical protein
MDSTTAGHSLTRRTEHPLTLPARRCRLQSCGDGCVSGYVGADGCPRLRLAPLRALGPIDCPALSDPPPSALSERWQYALRCSSQNTPAAMARLPDTERSFRLGWCSKSHPLRSPPSSFTSCSLCRPIHEDTQPAGAARSVELRGRRRHPPSPPRAAQSDCRRHRSMFQQNRALDSLT